MFFHHQLNLWSLGCFLFHKLWQSSGTLWQETEGSCPESQHYIRSVFCYILDDFLRGFNLHPWKYSLLESGSSSSQNSLGHDHSWLQIPFNSLKKTQRISDSGLIELKFTYNEDLMHEGYVSAMIWITVTVNLFNKEKTAIFPFLWFIATETNCKGSSS